MVMRRIVTAVQLLTLAAVAGFVVALFTNEPAAFDGGATAGGAVAAVTPAAPSGEEPSAPVEVDAAGVYADRCAGCHGARGEGSLAPALASGRVAARFPDIEAQVSLVTTGAGGMPGFGGRLSEEEIRAVVRYTRAL